MVFARTFWLQSTNTLPLRSSFFIFEMTPFGSSFSSVCATAWANPLAAS